MNEIEVKAKLKDREGLLEQLKKLELEMRGEKYQKDVVFWPNDIKNTETHILGRNFLRIREQKQDEKKKIIFTLKQPQTNQTDCIEHEIEIQEKDTLELTSLIYALGFYKFVEIEKTRMTAKMGDTEICIDDVTGLGSFIELEKFGPAEKAEEIQNELYALLESWGIQKEEYIYDGYDILVHKAQKKI